MTRQQMTAEILALPIEDRVALAQELWQSIHGDAAKAEDFEAHERAVLAEVKRRASELDAGTVTGVSHEEVMEAAAQLLV